MPVRRPKLPALAATAALLLTLAAAGCAGENVAPSSLSELIRNPLILLVFSFSRESAESRT
jgi:hypothetical protein